MTPRFNEATLAQITAARPDASTWLAANAGSGKTRVLTDRVARLLLEGVQPEHILCLTYTKAAATEMQNRLFKRLGGWAMKDDDALRGELGQLGVEADLSAEYLRQARTLFARAIEAPGGLRIQTIHAFCAALLRRFPLEAGVSPQFTEMEDRAADLLREEILDAMAEGPEAALIAGIAPHVSGDDTASLLRTITGARDAFLPPRDPETLAAAYDLPAEAGPDYVLAQVFLGTEVDLAAQVSAHLAGGGKTDVALSEALRGVTAPDFAGLKALSEALLTQTGTIRKTLGTKGKRTSAPDLFERLDQLAARVEAARGVRNALDALTRDRALHAFAVVFLEQYETEKARRGWLDFDDLITRTRDLLETPAVAEWVLYRLDGGIDHILVDEAQDTSPVQWQVIERLAQEFTAGQGARADVTRTIFVVGDKKQSIYSFQGADPSGFDRMRDSFAEGLEASGAPLNAMMLEYSFRSAAPILDLVDHVFDDAEDSGFTPDQRHRAFNRALPGRVELWPVVVKVDDQTEGDWFDPVDRVADTHHTVVLAQRIAARVRAMIDGGATLPDMQNGKLVARPVTAGDIMVLVRRRSALFAEIIRACKQQRIPIAGADRLKVMAELAVRDIMALLSFLATPEDDLSLAITLRSPLVGMSEADLYHLAQPRGGRYLWQHMRAERDRFPKVMAFLDDLRAQVDFLRPYDLIDRILTRHDGRRRLIGRLGPEAEDGIDALLAQALSYEGMDVPSLTGFLHWAETDELQIKRAPDGGGVLRVMTVHGSKGLEAPIVILPDCGPAAETLKGALLTDPAGAMWKTRADAMPPRQSEAAAAAKAREAQERDRLLYVALTRAEKWLIVTAAGDLGKSGNSWWEAVEKGMRKAGALSVTHDFGPLGQGPGMELGQDWGDLPLWRPETRHVPSAILPEALLLPPPAPTRPAEARQPSDLGGPKALRGAEGEPEEIAKARGTLLHGLLEYLAPLPPAERAEVAPNLLQTLLDAPEAAPLADRSQALLAEAVAVLQAPDLARFFAPDTLAEVPVSADLPGLGRIHGVIDRLIVAPDHVLAVDFKSNRVVPATPDEVPEGLLRQMGAYAAALAQVYPGKRIETGLIWTASAHYMRLNHEDVTQALGRATVP